MAATFPGGVKVFTTKEAGDQIASAHINDLQAEVVAVETELRKTTGSVVSHGSLAGLSNNDHPQYLLSASTNYPRADGWIPVSGTWTYKTATSITVPSGAANIYSVGMGIRLTANGVVKQAYIVKVENTLLTVAGDALTNYTFSAKSYTPTPSTALGFPVWFDYIPSYEDGWTSMPTGTYRFTMTGKLVQCVIAITAGTSDSVEAAIGLPTQAAASASVNRGTWGWAQDNGVQVNPAGGYVIDTANHAIRFFKTSIDGADWTASGTKRIYCTFFYEAA